MDYITVAQAAELWGLTPRRVRALLTAGRIPGATKPGHDWLIPSDTEKPKDLRYKGK